MAYYQTSVLLTSQTRTVHFWVWDISASTLFARSLATLGRHFTHLFRTHTPALLPASPPYPSLKSQHHHLDPTCTLLPHWLHWAGQVGAGGRRADHGRQHGRKPHRLGMRRTDDTAFLALPPYLPLPTILSGRGTGLRAWLLALADTGATSSTSCLPLNGTWLCCRGPHTHCLLAKPSILDCGTAAWLAGNMVAALRTRFGRLLLRLFCLLSSPLCCSPQLMLSDINGLNDHRRSPHRVCSMLPRVRAALHTPQRLLLTNAFRPRLTHLFLLSRPAESCAADAAWGYSRTPSVYAVNARTFSFSVFT